VPATPLDPDPHQRLRGMPASRVSPIGVELSVVERMVVSEAAVGAGLASQQCSICLSTLGSSEQPLDSAATGTQVGDAGALAHYTRGAACRLPVYSRSYGCGGRQRDRS
jgi:hypothetical protein